MSRVVCEHVVLDSSVLIAAARPTEPAHRDALEFIERLRDAQARGAARAFGPTELWLEAHVAKQRLPRSREAPADETSPTHDLSIEMIAPQRAEDLVDFLDVLARRTYGKRPFANATDLVYLWAAVAVGAALVTLDEGLLKYHRVVCEVMRPQHVRFA